MYSCLPLLFFFNDTATTEIYTLSLHDALPISRNAIDRKSRVSPITRSTKPLSMRSPRLSASSRRSSSGRVTERGATGRSEEHTSELQSRQYLVCRLLLEKKNQL